MKRALLPGSGGTNRNGVATISGHTREPIALITTGAFRTMLDEVRPSPVETGGIMVGVLDPLIVLAAGSGGNQAVREPTRFCGDTSADQRCLDGAKKRFGQCVAIVGAYHKHPSGVSRFSGQDLHQAREWARHFADGKPMLVGIFAEHCPKPEPTLFLYSIDGEAAMLEPIEYSIVKDDDEQVLDAIERTPVNPEVTQADYWSDANFRFYSSVTGLKRIQRELTALRLHGWDVVVGRKRGEQSLRLALLRTGQELRLDLPPEYPLNPPRLFLADQRELVGLPELSSWNSEYSLVELAARCVEVMACAQCTARHTRPVLNLEPNDEQ